MFSNVEGESFVSAPNNSIEKQLSGRYKNTKNQLTSVSAQSSVSENKDEAMTTPLSNIPTSIASKPAWTNMPLYVEPNNTASAYAAANSGSQDIATIVRMGQQPVSHWFGDWDVNVATSVDAYVTAASAAGSVPVLVFYNIPNRDCGSYSAGGVASSSTYIQWVRQAASGLAGRTAVVVLEPDAVAGADCLDAAGEQDRYKTIAQAVTIIKSQSNAAVYIDAGNPTWQSASTTATRLKLANIAAADGFSLNVANFSPTALNISYGDKVSQLTNGKHYIIDTSRSGGSNKVTGALYNPPFASLGNLPTTRGLGSKNDAFLWIKIPWESDAPVNGGPEAGSPYWSYAIQLAQNAGW